jgi:hypothetical protein
MTNSGSYVLRSQQDRHDKVRTWCCALAVRREGAELPRDRER